MIELKNICFKYEEKFVLNNISLRIQEGSYTAIIGANGSGKTTLGKHLNGLLVPSKGNVIVDGLNTKQNELDIRKKVGFVFQNFEDQLIYSIVEEDVAFGLENLEMKYVEIKKTVDNILRELNIDQIAKSNVNMISIGQKQLVALAGVLAMKPKYIVFDEPTTMLDAKNKKNIMQIINRLSKSNITIILVTNVLDDIRYAEEVILLKEGRVIFKGKKQKLTKKLLLDANLND